MNALDFLDKENKKKKESVNNPLQADTLKSEPKQSSEQAELKRDVPVQPEVPMQNVVVHSEIDAHIFDRLKSQPKTLEEINVEVVSEPEPGRHQLSLPDELEEYTEKYAFCWIFKRKKSMDEAFDLLHYKLVNHTLFPELPNHIFSACGVVERGDNILMFRSKRVDEEMRRAPGIESRNRIKARETAHEGNPNFYIPEPEYEKQLDGSTKKIPVVGV